MIGNAIPLAFTYRVGEAMKGTLKEDLRLPSEIDANGLLPGHSSTRTRPDNSGRSYPFARRFRFSIPEFRFKSGTRFELSSAGGPNSWKIAFFRRFKRIRSHHFERENVSTASQCSSEELCDRTESAYGKLDKKVDASDLKVSDVSVYGSK